MGKAKERVKPMLAYETAHISSDYRVIQQDSAACHLLGNMFTLYAELNTYIQSHIYRANTQFFPTLTTASWKILIIILVLY